MYDDEGNLFVEVCRQLRRYQSRRAPQGRPAIQKHRMERNTSTRTSARFNGTASTLQQRVRNVVLATTIFRYSVSSRASHLRGQDGAQGRRKPAAVLDSRRQNRRAQSERLGWVMLYDYPAGGSPAKTIKDALEPQAAMVSPASDHKVAVSTYHYDNLRTGWNETESTLTYENVQQRIVRPTALGNARRPG